MIQEYVPKGYSNWWEYNTKRRERKERLNALAFASVMFIAYCAVGYVECI